MLSISAEILICKFVEISINIPISIVVAFDENDENLLKNVKKLK